MFGFTTLTLGALAAASFTSAAPLSERQEAPGHYAEGYLEPYSTYHTRYLAIGCSGQQKTSFFDECCRPMLATETLEANRAEKCWPSAQAASSAAAAEPSSNAATDGSKFEWAVSNTTDYASSTAAAESTQAAAAKETSVKVTSVKVTSTWVAPSTTSSEAPAQTKASSSGADVKTNAQATYFYQNGNPGACGNYNSDSTPIVAIDSAWWSNFGTQSDLCGKSVTIKRISTGATVVATIADVCPTCVSANSLDLSVGAFNAIATSDEGSVSIEWWFNN